jgi:hypothetical protein
MSRKLPEIFRTAQKFPKDPIEMRQEETGMMETRTRSWDPYEGNDHPEANG